MIIEARKIVIIAGIVGLSIPVTIMGIDSLSQHGWWPAWILYIWPTSYMLGATSGIKEFADYVIIVVSIAVNGVIYGYLASVLNRLVARHEESGSA